MMYGPLRLSRNNQITIFMYKQIPRLLYAVAQALTTPSLWQTRPGVSYSSGCQMQAVPHTEGQWGLRWQADWEARTMLSLRTENKVPCSLSTVKAVSITAQYKWVSEKWEYRLGLRILDPMNSRTLCSAPCTTNDLIRNFKWSAAVGSLHQRMVGPSH